MRIFEILTAVSLMAINVGYSAAEEYEKTTDGRSFFFDNTSNTYGYWDEAAQKWYYYENGKAHDWETSQELSNIKLPQPSEHIAKNSGNENVKVVKTINNVKNSEPATLQTRSVDNRLATSNEIANKNLEEKILKLSRDFQPPEKRNIFTKLQTKFKKHAKKQVDEPAQKAVDMEKANQELNAMMNDLYPLYKKNRGPKAISNFESKKNKKS